MDDLEDDRCEDDWAWHVFILALCAAFVAELLGTFMMTWVYDTGRPTNSICTCVVGVYYLAKFALLASVASSRYLLREPPIKAFVWLVSSPTLILIFLGARLLYLWHMVWRACHAV
jgi:hypothetical protein